MTVNSKKSNLTYRARTPQYKLKKIFHKRKSNSLNKHSLNPNSKCLRLKINLKNSLIKLKIPSKNHTQKTFSTIVTGRNTR